MSLHTEANLLGQLDPIPFVTARVRQFDERLMAIILSDGPLSDEDRAYLDAAERAAS